MYLQVAYEQEKEYDEPTMCDIWVLSSINCDLMCTCDMRSFWR